MLCIEGIDGTDGKGLTKFRGKMSDRIDRIQESGIRKIFAKAATMKDVVNMSIGQPDFEVPSSVKDGIIKAIQSDKTKYTPSAGIDELREKIVNKHGFGSAIVTSGTSGAIFLSYSALLDEGDKVYEPYLQRRYAKDTSQISYKLEAEAFGWRKVNADIFGGTIIVRRTPFADQATKSRSIVINTKYNPGS